MLCDDGDTVILNSAPDANELPLSKLNVYDMSDIVVESVDDQKGVDEGPLGTDVFRVLIERDDEHGTKRLYLRGSDTLQQLFDMSLDKFGLDKELPRRLRWMVGNRIFTLPQYTEPI